MTLNSKVFFKLRNPILIKKKIRFVVVRIFVITFRYLKAYQRHT